MKTKFALMITILILGLGIAACSKPAKDPNISHYTCPMHPQIKMDDPGQCPICHMDLVPVYKDGMNHSEHSEPQSKEDSSEENALRSKAVTISKEQQASTGIKVALVEKKNVTLSIRAFGKAAYDPDLAVAQSEYLAVLRSAPELKKGAFNRLRLLGMSEEEIRNLEKTRKTGSELYLPDGAPIWIYASLFENDAGLISIGDKAVVSVSGSDLKLNGIVKSLSPIIDAQTRTITARIQLSESSSQLKPNSFVNVEINKELGAKLTIPKTAVIETGERSVAYVVHDGNHFQQREIKTSGETQNEMIMSSGLKEGDTVASAGLFMLDSEAQLRGSDTTATHQH